MIDEVKYVCTILWTSVMFTLSMLSSLAAYRMSCVGAALSQIFTQQSVVQLDHK